MMTTNKRPFPMTDQERQITPLPGEVDPRDARRVAIHVAAVARLRPREQAKSAAAALPAKPGKR